MGLCVDLKSLQHHQQQHLSSACRWATSHTYSPLVSAVRRPPCSWRTGDGDEDRHLCEINLNAHPTKQENMRSVTLRVEAVGGLRGKEGGRQHKSVRETRLISWVVADFEQLPLILVVAGCLRVCVWSAMPEDHVCFSLKVSCAWKQTYRPAWPPTLACDSECLVLDERCTHSVVCFP